MDLITGLPLTANGFDAIFTFVHRLSKSVHLCHTSATIDAAGTANLYIQNVFRLHGLSRSIFFDWDPRFTAEFFKEVFSRLGSKLKFSTANHRQTDGQRERANRVVGDFLRSFVNHRQNNWEDCLPFWEFTINDMLQESTKETPFMIVYQGRTKHSSKVANEPPSKNQRAFFFSLFAFSNHVFLHMNRKRMSLTGVILQHSNCNCDLEVAGELQRRRTVSAGPGSGHRYRDRDRQRVWTRCTRHSGSRRRSDVVQRCVAIRAATIEKKRAVFVCLGGRL